MKNMMTMLMISLFIIMTVNAQTIPVDSLYLGKKKPGKTAVVFNLPSGLGLRPIERIAISNDGKEIYYSELDTYPPSVLKIRYLKYENNKWQGPFDLFNGFMGPRLSPNDSTLYLIELDATGTSYAYYSNRTAAGWSTPKRMYSPAKQTHYFQKTSLNNYFISSDATTSAGNRDICRFVVKNNDTTFVNLGKPVNTLDSDENDFFVSYDESYMIFSRASSSIPGDMFITYKTNNGRWTNPKKLNSSLNTADWEYGHYVTNDKKYLFFTRGGRQMSTYFTYWVNLGNTIDSLKTTNYIPYLNSKISTQQFRLGEEFSYTIPDTVIIDDDGINTLTFTAKLSSGQSLPSWLTFNSTSRTFTGTPTKNEKITLTISAKDISGTLITTNFDMTFSATVDVESENLPIKTELKQNYPNPFNPSTTIAFSIAKEGRYSLEVYNSLGQKVMSVSDKEYQVGSYSYRLNCKDLSSGIYFYQLRGNEINQIKKMMLIK